MDAAGAVKLLAAGRNSEYQRLVAFWRMKEKTERTCQVAIKNYLELLFQRTKAAVESARKTFVRSHVQEPEVASRAFAGEVAKQMPLYHAMAIERGEPKGDKPQKQTA